VRAIERFHTFGVADIPNVNDRIPASRNQSVFVNEFDAKYSVGVARIIPFCSV
jgi:hypothetical protein